MYSLIAAIDSKYGIAKQGSIPWDYAEDMKYFKDTTMGHVVIMGRKTWESIPLKHRPLSGRINVVLTTNNEIITTQAHCPHYVFSNIDNCIKFFSDTEKKKCMIRYKLMTKFVIGGSAIYNQFIQRNLISRVHLTHINKDYDCDQFLKLPSLIDMGMPRQSDHKHISYHNYATVNHEETQHLNLMQHILDYGEKRIDRTGTGTLSVFSRELRFDLSRGQIPMMTTRPLSLRIIFEELMWIIRGQTDNKILNEKKIHIWDDNTNREFLDDHKLSHYEEGDIGPSYGFQMAHFGAEYKNASTNYSDCGFNQINAVVDQLKNNPTSRRILISLWNPTQLSEMALPPCVYGYQFYVSSGKLSCKIIQRSSDIALAGSHNCTAGAVLVRLLCTITGLNPGELIWSPADIHIYLNQVNAVKEQIKRIPHQYPTLIVRKPKKDNIEAFNYSDLDLLNYEPHAKIKFAMNA
jgi:dihydrofolate reductase/thymidylate synthase